ncbi:sugar kinase [Aestuariibacter sp. A3R04]|uniref:sugar kinase n=1 Tax=Aestuariibacter sp. A3R04 TaxID=2841571 RepID=UPI001C08CC6B|nr:sugar kinase [Aestuariibacter sp. A3R04]
MRLAIIGECMVELSNSENDLYHLGFGGDTLNTAVYYSRCGGDAEYVTALSDDILSKKMLQQWQAEGVGTQHVKIMPNTVPGLYLIENDDGGERHFHYWRTHSPARYLLDNFPRVLDELNEYDAIFLSGITLSLYSSDTRKMLCDFLQYFRGRGGLVIFDNNYRPRNWSSVSEASAAFNEIMHIADLALLSMEDEIALHGEHSMPNCLARWLKSGATEVVIKNGAEGVLAGNTTDSFKVAVPTVVKPVDTTAAGDSFNGAFLASKARGQSLAMCVRAGQYCAAQVIMHKGAIVPRDVNLIEGAA